ncbi:hypothetical protein ACOSQ3_024060 [Xanthoceras sorbifolium]
MNPSSSILRSLSLSKLVRLSASSSSSAVAPLPVTTKFDHHHQLNTTGLHFQSQNSNINLLLLHALDASITTQQITLDSLSSNVTHDQHSDREIINDYLDFNVEMLDTCNDLTEKIDTIQNYVESLKVVSHLLEAGGRNGAHDQPHPTTLARARHVLDSSQAILETTAASNQYSIFKRFFFSQKKPHDDQGGGGGGDSKLGEILSGSKAVTSMVCEILRTALSFKSNRGLLPLLLLLLMQTRTVSSSSTSWSCSLRQQLQKQIKEHQKSGSSMKLIELHQTVKAARNLRAQIKGSRNRSNQSDVEELKRRCKELEEGIKPFERRVKELYKHLISVRMVLLGILSHY